MSPSIRGEARRPNRPGELEFGSRDHKLVVASAMLVADVRRSGSSRVQGLNIATARTGRGALQDLKPIMFAFFPKANIEAPSTKVQVRQRYIRQPVRQRRIHIELSTDCPSWDCNLRWTYLNLENSPLGPIWMMFCSSEQRSRSPPPNGGINYLPWPENTGSSRSSNRCSGDFTDWVRTFFWQCSCLPTILLFPGRYVASLLYEVSAPRGSLRKRAANSRKAACASRRIG